MFAAKQLSKASTGLVSRRMKHTLPDLPYDYNALEPVVSAEIMLLHHKKHHQAYVNNLIVAEDKIAEAKAKNDLSTVISTQQALKFNGGGHINHSIFWTNLAPISQGGGEPPKGALLNAINKEFGSMDAFVQRFNGQAAAVQGSGWGWLGYSKLNKRLEIATTFNQDPVSTVGLVPLLGIDVWEHAYYLQYKNVRPDYLKEIWKVVNWNNVSERFINAQQ